MLLRIGIDEADVDRGLDRWLVNKRLFAQNFPLQIRQRLANGKSLTERQRQVLLQSLYNHRVIDRFLSVRASAAEIDTLGIRRRHKQQCIALWRNCFVGAGSYNG